MIKRFAVILPGIFVLMIVAWLFALGMCPSGSDRFWPWLIICGGPIIDMKWHLSDHAPLILAGWLGLPFILSHPIKPSCLTGVFASVGFLLWLMAGVISVGVAASAG